MPVKIQHPLSQETKDNILQRFLQTPDEAAIAHEFRVSVSTVAKITTNYFNAKPAFRYIQARQRTRKSLLPVTA